MVYVLLTLPQGCLSRESGPKTNQVGITKHGGLPKPRRQITRQTEIASKKSHVELKKRPELEWAGGSLEPVNTQVCLSSESEWNMPFTRLNLSFGNVQNQRPPIGATVLKETKFLIIFYVHISH